MLNSCLVKGADLFTVCFIKQMCPTFHMARGGQGAENAFFAICECKYLDRVGKTMGVY